MKVDRQKNFFLYVESEKEDVTPFYFEREYIEKLIKIIRQQQPNFSLFTEVKVTPLFGEVFASLEENK